MSKQLCICHLSKQLSNIHTNVRLLLIITVESLVTNCWIATYNCQIASWTPVLTEGPIKSRFAYLSLCLSVQHFSQDWPISFFRFFAQWQIIRIFKNWWSSFFQGNSFLPKFWRKGPNMVPKQFFFIFWKILLLGFPKNNLKWKLILLLIFHYESHILENSDWRVIGQNAVSQSNCMIL